MLGAGGRKRGVLAVVSTFIYKLQQFSYEYSFHDQQKYDGEHIALDPLFEIRPLGIIC